MLHDHAAFMEANMRMAWQGSIVVAALLFMIATGVGEAQSIADCSAPHRPAFGIALGRSSPYFEPSLASGGPGTSGSTLTRGSVVFDGRLDLSIAGAWRARVEGAVTDWRLERQIYSADLRQVVATETVGHVDVRNIVGLAGWQGGRAPVCGYVLGGGGLYSLGYQEAKHRSPGVALTAGVEIPGGPRGVVQVEVQLHLINAQSRYPIGSSTVLDDRIVAGWAYRF